MPEKIHPNHFHCSSVTRSSSSNKLNICWILAIYINDKVYKSLVRPHLDYCIQAWRPVKQKYIDVLEAIHRRMSRIIPELRNLYYPSRLRILKITTLETRRVRADLLEVIKIINGWNSNFPADFIMENEHGKTSGHPYKISKLHSRLDILKHSKDSNRLE